MTDADNAARDQARADAEGWEGLTIGFGVVMLLCGLLVSGFGVFCLGTGTIGVSWLLLEAANATNPSVHQGLAVIIGVLASLGGFPLVVLGAMLAVPGAGWLFAVQWGRWRSRVSHQD